MAITPVPNTYPGFIFDGENSRTYGVYITDVSVFGTPEREVELLPIPGRNGDYALDKGRYTNITVRYECALPTENPADFVAGVADFRNMLASRIGYKRLEDEINTTEYRMALFSAGIDVDTLNKEAGTFAVDFECKPQRFLKTGEVPVAGTNPLTLTNPTLYEASPLLNVVGYGGVTINGEAVTIIDNPIGNVQIAPQSGYVAATIDSGGASALVDHVTYPNYAPLVVGDTVTIGNDVWNGGGIAAKFIVSFSPLPSVGQITWSTDGGLNATIKAGNYVNITVPALTYTAGTPTNRATETITLTVARTGGNSVFSVVLGWQVLPHPGVFDVGIDMEVTRTSYTGTPYKIDEAPLQVAPFVGFSTYAAYTEPIYIDLDIGDAYTYNNNELVPYNSNVILPGKLPTLKPGGNTIETVGQHITSYEITPRWWQL